MFIFQFIQLIIEILTTPIIISFFYNLLIICVFLLFIFLVIWQFLTFGEIIRICLIFTIFWFTTRSYLIIFKGVLGSYGWGRCSHCDSWWSIFIFTLLFWMIVLRSWYIMMTSATFGGRINENLGIVYRTGTSRYTFRTL